jgi:ferrochelatase
MSAPSRTGVLLVNLGTPDDPSIPAVRRFLAEFLSDRRVIDYPRILWLPILYGVILRVRPPKTAHAYAQIWTKDGSPLLIRSRALANALQSSLGSEFIVELGMTYGSPSVANSMQVLKGKGVDRLLVIPLYPQYSTTTTAPVLDRVQAELKKWNKPPPLTFIEHYYDDAGYLDALAQSVRDFWAKNARKHLLFSFHGIPQRYVTNGDPYFDHCQATARETAARLQIGPKEWSVAFQSRVGKERWVEPYTDKVLLEYAQAGPKEISMICPAFATDNLETLEEISIRGRESFLAAGGTSFDYIPCLNDDASHVNVFADIVRRRTSDSGRSPEAGHR